MKQLSRPLILIMSLFLIQNIYAGHVSQQSAKEAATHFFISQLNRNQPHDLSVNLADTRIHNDQTLMYIFNIEDQGFVIISAWDGTIPVLGYSNAEIFPQETGNQPPAFQEMMNFYEEQIGEAIAKDLKATPEISAAWDGLINPANFTDNGRSVSPLLTSTWSQSCYYNELCPEDENAPYGYCGHVPVGCVATAMAQVMKYWEYPITGTGSHSYSVPPYGVQSADFGNTTYAWENMPNTVGSSNISVATLIYHCAVSVEMQFSPNGSGASSWDAMNALENNFDYDPEAQFYYKSSYTDEEWESMLREELDLGRPVIYRGQGTGGHAWVCDGYSADDYFHMNWGWGGYANGYFYLSNLNPAGLNFTTNQAAIMHIKPENAAVEPPRNLVAEVIENDVHLSWEEPLESQWINWDDGSTQGALGVVGGGSFDAAAKWDPEHLEPFDGMYITKVTAYLASSEPDYYVKIWTGPNAANLVYSQPVSDMVANSWNMIVLDEAVEINTATHLYVGISVTNQPNTHSAVGYDGGPAVEGYGNLVSFNGITWTTLSNYSMNVNWNIQAYVNTSAEGKNTATGILPEKPNNNKASGRLIAYKVKGGTQVTHPENRTPIGYNVYRNGAKINDEPVGSLQYIDEDVPNGTHEYFVTSFYNAGESAPGNIVSVVCGLVAHEIQLEAGWNSISSSLIPLTTGIEEICMPIMGNLICMLDMTGFYYPAMGINTLQNWNYENGYLIKVEQACTLPFNGLPSEDQSLQLDAGWNLIPVLSDCEVPASELFMNILTDFIVVKDAAGTGVYWPAKGINTLSALEPGKAYFVKMQNSNTATFPACE